MSIEKQAAYDQARRLIECGLSGTLEEGQFVSRKPGKKQPWIGFSRDMTKLYFQGTALSRLPPEIGQLDQLEALYLQENNLTILPPEICRLKSLKNLYLSKNQLRELPHEIGCLALLTYLFAHENHLETLPAGIGELTALEILRLECNRLRYLPTEMGRLSSLKGLYLHENHALEIPDRELGPEWQPANPRTILNYYFSKIERKAIRNTSINVMIDNKKITIGNVSNSTLQIGQTLTECNSMVQVLEAGEEKKLLGELVKQVGQLIQELPDDKKAMGPDIAQDLGKLIQQSTAKPPKRKWCSLSAEGILKAATWVGSLATPIAATIGELKKLLSP